jgi:lipid-A-disaccharide synthase
VPRIFLVAGESSGDTHGANLVRALHELDPAVACEGLGGQRMARAGMTLHHDLAATAIMGFAEVVKSLGYIRRLFHDTVARLRANPPDCLVLIDYPGFNIRLAVQARALGIPVVYYISPQVWAWKKGRLRTIARTVDRMLVILPFEEAFYREAGVPATYVGHPLLDHLPAVPIEGRYRDGLTVGILPGSRGQEIARILPVLLATARGIQEQHPEARFVAPCVDDVRAAQIDAARGNFPLTIDVGGMYEVLDGARFCMVASGTATVETCLFGVPMVICYRIAPLSYLLARLLVRIDHIGMVNILAGRRIVPEFVQHEATAERILPHALALLGDTPERARMLAGLASVRESLGGPGASRRAAEAVLEVARKA